MLYSKNIKKHLKIPCGSTGRFAMLLLLFSPAIAKAQRQRVYNNGVWAGYYTNAELGKGYSLVTQMEVRTRQWTNRWHQQLLDIGVANQLNAKWRIATGAAWYRSAQYSDEFFFKNEWRLWQETNHTLGGQKLTFLQRVKVDERWIQEVSNGKKMNSYAYITRMHYKSELQKPLHNEKITPVLGNEFMFNPFNLGTDKAFDQNRTWLGVNVKLTRAVILQCHYLKIYQWRSGNILDNQNIIRVNFVQHFNMKNS